MSLTLDYPQTMGNRHCLHPGAVGNWCFMDGHVETQRLRDTIVSRNLWNSSNVSVAASFYTLVDSVEAFYKNGVECPQ